MQKPPEPPTTYAALRQAMGLAVDAMIRADNMWSINSIPRLQRAWLAAVDAVEMAGRDGMGPATSPHSAPAEPGYGMQQSPCPRRDQTGA